MNDYRKVLVSPDGDEYVSTSARETNDLIYGSGYREAEENADNTAASDKSDEVPPADPYAYGGEVSP